MVNLVYMYEVAPEKQEEYLKVTAEVIKPYWESHGCQAYQIYQDAEGGTAFIKEMLFPDVASMQRTIGLKDTDEECKAVVARFRSFASNVVTKLYVRKV